MSTGSYAAVPTTAKKQSSGRTDTSTESYAAIPTTAGKQNFARTGAFMGAHWEYCSMKWKKFTLDTTTEAVDYLGSLFEEIGIEGMEIEDNVPLTESETKGMFIDILPELP